MLFAQPSIPRPPSDVSLASKTILITGANRGLGFAATRTLLLLGAGKLIFPVRCIPKGEAARAKLLADPEVQASNANATIEILHLDLQNYSSILECVRQVERMCDDDVDLLDLGEKARKTRKQGLDALILNASASYFSSEFKATCNGHERMLQVNYLSNALLAISLLPLLKATAAMKGTPTRITWMGSSRYRYHTLNNGSKIQAVLKEENSVLGYMDDKARWEREKWIRYNDTKLFAALFVRELAARISSDEVIVNMCCPSMANTGITDDLPRLVWVMMKAIVAVHARSRQEGGWVIVRAGVGKEIGSDSENHGMFLKDGHVNP
ncbi:MAG: hypothetical protein MMC33_008220 [Icmadophila ericetorum]|nr:hypothetical protein [Icmadophila ericetorum]